MEVIKSFLIESVIKDVVVGKSSGYILSCERDSKVFNLYLEKSAIITNSEIKKMLKYKTIDKRILYTRSLKNKKRSTRLIPICNFLVYTCVISAPVYPINVTCNMPIYSCAAIGITNIRNYNITRIPGILKTQIQAIRIKYNTDKRKDNTNTKDHRINPKNILQQNYRKPATSLLVRECLKQILSVCQKIKLTQYYCMVVKSIILFKDIHTLCPTSKKACKLPNKIYEIASLKRFLITKGIIEDMSILLACSKDGNTGSIYPFLITPSDIDSHVGFPKDLQYAYLRQFAENKCKKDKHKFRCIFMGLLTAYLLRGNFENDINTLVKDTLEVCYEKGFYFDLKPRWIKSVLTQKNASSIIMKNLSMVNGQLHQVIEWCVKSCQLTGSTSIYRTSSTKNKTLRLVENDIKVENKKNNNKKTNTYGIKHVSEVTSLQKLDKWTSLFITPRRRYNKIKSMSQTLAKIWNKNPNRLVDTVKSKYCAGLTPSQTKAMIHISSHNITQITGAGGTGKTHMIKMALKYMLDHSQNIILTTNYCGSEDVLLSRFGSMYPVKSNNTTPILEDAKNNPPNLEIRNISSLLVYYKINKDLAELVTAIIIDEAQNVSTTSFCNIINILPNLQWMVMLGDEGYQLGPVDQPPNTLPPMEDLYKRYPTCRSELLENMRVTKGSRIAMFLENVRKLMQMNHLKKDTSSQSKVNGLVDREKLWPGVRFKDHSTGIRAINSLCEDYINLNSEATRYALTPTKKHRDEINSIIHALLTNKLRKKFISKRKHNPKSNKDSNKDSNTIKRSYITIEDPHTGKQVRVYSGSMIKIEKKYHTRILGAGDLTAQVNKAVREHVKSYNYQKVCKIIKKINTKHNTNVLISWPMISKQIVSIIQIQPAMVGSTRVKLVTVKARGGPLGSVKKQFVYGRYHVQSWSISLGYCSTVHGCLGGEASEVLTYFPMSSMSWCDMKVVYTMLSRALKSITVYSAYESNKKSQSSGRSTMLAKFIQGYEASKTTITCSQNILYRCLMNKGYTTGALPLSPLGYRFPPSDKRLRPDGTLGLDSYNPRPLKQLKS